jgi:hypothetical protein
MANVQYPDTPESPARKLVAITPADTDLAFEPKAIWASGAGTLVITAIDDTVAVTLTVAAGTLLPIKARRIAAASTATGLVALI